MKLLDSISIRGKKGKRIELYQGDLTSLHPNEAVDLLVVSAFPNDYIPTPTSLIGALYKKGLSVGSLAAKFKERDLRKNFSCWLSNEFIQPDPGIQFRRILCFEPSVRGEPPELVGDIFRSLTPILAETLDISSIAMPLVAAGDQGYPISSMLIPLLDAAIHWMETGLPLDCIKIVAHSEQAARQAKKVFSERKSVYQHATPPSQAQVEYDVFISYARENNAEMEILEKQLTTSRPYIRIFIDRKDINIGSPWQPQIFESLDKCRKVVVLFSPDYLNSKVCKEEFNIAWVRSREIDQDMIFPIYLYSADLPTYMKYRNYLDCREGNKAKLLKASDRLLTALDS